MKRISTKKSPAPGEVPRCRSGWAPPSGRDRKSGSAGMPRPRSTPLPYTTLFRSELMKNLKVDEEDLDEEVAGTGGSASLPLGVGATERQRSEERVSRNAETEIYTPSLHDALPI